MTPLLVDGLSTLIRIAGDINDEIIVAVAEGAITMK
jgi:hypothetical protein